MQSEFSFYDSRFIKTNEITQNSPLLPLVLLLRKVNPLTGQMNSAGQIFRRCSSRIGHVWQTASLYHLVHTAALLAAPSTKNPNIFGGLLTAGILAFSGTCYTVALLEDRKYSSLAPFGGFAFIGAWASLLF
ncbi:hypothetical protein Csa_020159 [Cucumis sativus]|nr:hypothetical protein Csa_020159 [Cucumis sativus]